MLLAAQDVRSELVAIILSYVRFVNLLVLWPEKVRHVAREVELDRVDLLDEIAARAKPVDFLVAVKHDHTVGVAGGDVRGLLVILLVDEQWAW